MEIGIAKWLAGAPVEHQHLFWMFRARRHRNERGRTQAESRKMRRDVVTLSVDLARHRLPSSHGIGRGRSERPTVHIGRVVFGEATRGRDEEAFAHDTYDADYVGVERLGQHGKRP